MGSEGMRFEQETFQVGDLGRFSMRAIYDALAGSTQNAIPSTQRRPQYLDGEDSDCSWTQDDDNGTFYFDMQRQLNNFVSSDGQPTMTTAFLSRSQRRFVHATAQILRVGHASFGPPGKMRRMIVFKDPRASMLSIAGSLQPDQGGTSSPNKRRRLERVENGFPCHFCAKVFDRASERTKHEQAHQPNLTARFPCPVCAKGFRYPKDLRRHSKVHDKSLAAGSQSLSSSFGSGPSAPLESTLTMDSRVPSDTSLTFSSNAASKNVSPMMLAQDGEQMLDLNLQPLVPDSNGWAGGPNDWLCDPQFGFAYDEEDDFLEMTKARK